MTNVLNVTATHNFSNKYGVSVTENFHLTPSNVYRFYRERNKTTYNIINVSSVINVSSILRMPQQNGKGLYSIDFQGH